MVKLLLTSSRYYTISIIIGTIALAYGSVPLYKMVSRVHVFLVSIWYEIQSNYCDCIYRFASRRAGMANQFPLTVSVTAIPQPASNRSQMRAVSELHSTAPFLMSFRGSLRRSNEKSVCCLARQLLPSIQRRTEVPRILSE